MASLFGTDGIRAIVGSEPLTAQGLIRLGDAIGAWAMRSMQPEHQETSYILLAHDTRASCHFVKAALKAGLLLHDVVLCDMQAIPTPAACMLTRINKACCSGIIITASHNPYEYNGIKILTSTGSKINADDEKLISDLYEASTLKAVYNQYFGSECRTLDAREPYLHALQSYVEENFLAGQKIVLDCANGATSSWAPHIFSMFGAHVIAINNNPTGTNINAQCGTVFPRALQQAVLEHKADIGFAFDGDGDRLIAVSRHGAIKDGDDLLAILMHHPLHVQDHAIVGTLCTNEGLAAYAQQQGKKLFRVDVGDRHVARKLQHEKLTLGGETSGHILVSPYLDSSDGIFVALHVLQQLKYTDNWDMQSFNHYPQALINIPVATRLPLQSGFLSECITEHEQEAPGTRFVVRYSGTEPLLRILVEAPIQEQADGQARSLAKKLAAIIG